MIYPNLGPTVYDVKKDEIIDHLKTKEKDNIIVKELGVERFMAFKAIFSSNSKTIVSEFLNDALVRKIWPGVMDRLKEHHCIKPTNKSNNDPLKNQQRESGQSN